MIPRASCDPAPQLPSDAIFWLPSTGQGDDGHGLGYFHDTWVIRDVPPELASEVLRTEFGLAGLVDEAARSPEEFEMLLSAVESPDPENVDCADFGHVSEELMEELVSDVPPDLEGLELGVAGLVHALAAYGCVPAASCRGHVYDAPRRPWSDRPVAFFASDRERAEQLVPLARISGCGFNVDPERPRLILVEAPSIVESMRLAEEILRSISSEVSVEQRPQR